MPVTICALPRTKFLHRNQPGSKAGLEEFYRYLGSVVKGVWCGKSENQENTKAGLYSMGKAELSSCSVGD